MAASARDAASIACKVSSLASQIRSAVSRLLVDFDVTPAQADLFYHLLDGETSPSELARLVGVDGSNLSRQLATLEKRGLVERAIDPAHRARIVVQLTPTGAELAQAVDPHARVIQDAIGAALSPSQIKSFVTSLHKISDAMEEVGQSGSTSQ